MAGLIDRECFIAMLTEQFPAVAAGIDDCARGLLHLEMASLARVTQAAITSEDKTAVKEYFAFVGDLFRRAGPEVKSAVYVSFLENLSFDGRRGKRIKARELLSPDLQTALRELEAYNAALFARRRLAGRTNEL
jgi:hypothetical protein